MVTYDHWESQHGFAEIIKTVGPEHVGKVVAIEANTLSGYKTQKIVDVVAYFKVDGKTMAIYREMPRHWQGRREAQEYHKWTRRSQKALAKWLKLVSPYPRPARRRKGRKCAT